MPENRGKFTLTKRHLGSMESLHNFELSPYGKVASSARSAPFQYELSRTQEMPVITLAAVHSYVYGRDTSLDRSGT